MAKHMDTVQNGCRPGVKIQHNISTMYISATNNAFLEK